MKALSVLMPWAGLIRDGRKTIELRSWSTAYRGRLLICVSKQVKHPLAGKAICTVRLDSIRSPRPGDELLACKAPGPRDKCWVLTDVQPVDPFPVIGQMKIFSVRSRPRTIQTLP